jgi:UDPglucose 6-dehydrogenase
MSARHVCVVGAGYVGLTTAACLASLGHRVVCADADSAKVRKLQAGEVELGEPGLAELVVEQLRQTRLRFVVGARTAVAVRAAGGQPVETVFLCLPTPMGADGSADLRAVTQVLSEIGPDLPPGCLVVNKSTVPVGTGAYAQRLLGRDDVEFVSNPEFLREGTAVRDFLHPDRIVVGSRHPAAAESVIDLYRALTAPVLIMDVASAELTKYAANSFLAMKLSFVNALAELCERVGADIRAVAGGVGRDPRIGGEYFRPGPGWGGSCLPKDTLALLSSCSAAGFDFPLLEATIEINRRQADRVVDKIRAAAGGRLAHNRIGLLGLTFKAGTADVRDSPALEVAARLAAEGAELRCYDPGCSPTTPGRVGNMKIVDDPLTAACESDVLVLLTEWPQFRTLDWAAMARVMIRPVVVDTRNHLEPAVLRAAGFDWIGTGVAAHSVA